MTTPRDSRTSGQLDVFTSQRQEAVFAPFIEDRGVLFTPEGELIHNEV